MKLGRRLPNAGILMATLALLGSATSVRAGTIDATWHGGTGNWNVPTNWTPNLVPNNVGGNVFFVTISPPGGTPVVSLDINATIAGLLLGGNNRHHVTLQNLSGTPESLEVTGATTIGMQGTLTLGNASTLKLDGGLTLADTGQLNIDGGTVATITGNVFNNDGSITTSGGSTLTITGALTQAGHATLQLGSSGDVVNLGSLPDIKNLSIASGATLNLTNQPNGITSIPVGSVLTLAGTLKAGSANGFAKLTSVGGALYLVNGQTTSDTPNGGTLTAGGLMDVDAASSLTVKGNLVNNGATYTDSGGGGGGNTLTVTGAFTNNNGAGLLGSGDTLNVTGTFTNSAGASFDLRGSGDVANLSTLVNNGYATIGTGTTLNLTNQPNGITDVAAGVLTVNGTLKAGSANGLAKLTSVEGSLTLGNGQTTADTPSGGTLTVSGDLNLSNTNGATILSVTGGLNDSGSVTVGSGTTLNLTQGMTDLPATGSLYLYGTTNGLAKLTSVEGALTLGNGRTTADTPNGGTLTVASGGSLTLSNGGTTLSVTGTLTDSGNVTVNTGTTLNLTQGMTDLPGTLYLYGTTNGLAKLASVEGNLYVLNEETTSVTPSGGTVTWASGSFMDVAAASSLTVNGNLTNNTSLYAGYAYGGGNTLSVTGAFTNNGSVNMQGSFYGGSGDTLNVTGTLTNNAGANLYLYDKAGDVANVATLNNSGTVNIGNGDLLNLTASRSDSNSGTINVGSSSGAGTLKVSAPAVTLSGSGNVIMSNFAGNLITAAASTDVLTSANTIQGSGNIGNGTMGFVNTGSVLANQSTPLVIDPSSAGFNNEAILNVSTADTLRITGPAGSFLNFNSSTGTLTGGNYLVSGTLDLDISGQSNDIQTNAARIKLNGNSYAIIDQNGANALAAFTTNAATGIFFLAEGANFTTTGNFTNNGMLAVGTGSTFAVPRGFSLTNFSGPTLTGGAYTVFGTLQFPGANIVTNAANITLVGTSSQITDQNGANGLANFATNASTGQFTINTGRNFTTAGNFTNNGTLTVGSGSTFAVPTGFSLTNFSGTTLRGGTYAVAGTLQFNGANIVTNAANITLTGTTSQILNQTGGNGLANFATNASGGVFSLQGGHTFTTAGNFLNAGTFTIGSTSTFTVGGTGRTFIQTAGTTTDDGTLTLPSLGALTLNGGSLLGKGTISGAVTSRGTIAPGDSTTTTGILTDKGAYTQNSTGILDISIAGTRAGAQYDQFNSKAANLNGALNTTLINGFVPTIGEAFTIMNFSSEKGTFSKCDGRAGGTTCPINSGEHFNITYDSNRVVLTVASGAASSFRQFNRSSMVGPAYSVAEASSLGFRAVGAGLAPARERPYGAPLRIGRNLPRVRPPASAIAAVASPVTGEPFFASQARSGASLRTIGLGTRTVPSDWSMSSVGRLQTDPPASLGLGVMSAGKLASMDSVMRQNVLNRTAAFGPPRGFPAGTAPHGLVSVGASDPIRYRVNPAGALLRNNGHSPTMPAPRSLEYHLDLLSILSTSPRRALRDIVRQPGSPDVASFGYLTFGGIR